jgi:MSHA biogenesis protein MshP
MSTRRFAALRGFALVPALFLIVVLAALGAFAVRIGTAQSHTATLALQATRALEAARAGIEWGAYNANVNGSCSKQTIALAEGALAGFTVTVTCSATTQSTGSGTISAYVIDALAATGSYGTPDFAQRHLRAVFTNASS